MQGPILVRTHGVHYRCVVVFSMLLFFFFSIHWSIIIIKKYAVNSVNGTHGMAFRVVF